MLDSVPYVMFSAPYTPQENGKVERNWGTIHPMVRCLLKQAGLEKEYWQYALNMASEIKKFCFHSSIQRTPFEAMYKKKPHLESIKVFGCSAFVHVKEVSEARLIKILKREYLWGFQTIVRLIL